MRVGRARRARALSWSVGAVGSFVVVCAWAAWACLPDLEIAPPSQPSFCGDGVINPDAGEECDPGPDASAAALLACPLTPAPGCQVGNCPSDGGTFAFSDPASHHCYFLHERYDRHHNGRGDLRSKPRSRRPLRQRERSRTRRSARPHEPVLGRVERDCPGLGELGCARADGRAGLEPRVWRVLCAGERRHDSAVHGARSFGEYR